MTTQQMLDERYGRVRGPRARLWRWIGIAAAGAVTLGVIAWIALGNPAAGVSAEATGYRVVDARTVSLDFQVTAPVGAKVVCVLEADDTEHGVVGWRVVHLAAASGHTQSYTEQIPTVGLATTGLVNTCWVP